ncbi:hypothetical protein E4695_04150 [Alcaligenaceae bacterium 429]|nr:hypothetical protein E4695_04150 [Alcaligenaceae bacterium 429]
MRKFLMWFIVVVALLIAVAYGLRWWFISDLRKPILSEMTDPDSALFRNESFVGNWFGEGVYCGEVNGKNAMGGYVGYSEFFVWSAMGLKTQHHAINNMGLNKSYIDKHCNEIRYIDKPWWYIRW